MAHLEIEALNYISSKEDAGITPQELDRMFHMGLVNARTTLYRWKKSGYLTYIPGKAGQPGHRKGTRPLGKYVTSNKGRAKIKKKSITITPEYEDTWEDYYKRIST